MSEYSLTSNEQILDLWSKTYNTQGKPRLVTHLPLLRR
jgi:hypothetical protein